MAITKDRVRTEINASAASVPDTVIDAALKVATTLILKYVGTSREAVPVEILDAAVLAATVEKINIDQAPNGILNQQYDAGTEGTSVPIRIGRDPMKAAKPLLDPYVSGKFFCA